MLLDNKIFDYNKFISANNYNVYCFKLEMFSFNMIYENMLTHLIQFYPKTTQGTNTTF